MFIKNQTLVQVFNKKIELQSKHRKIKIPIIKYIGLKYSLELQLKNNIAEIFTKDNLKLYIPKIKLNLSFHAKI